MTIILTIYFSIGLAIMAVAAFSQSHDMPRHMVQQYHLSVQKRGSFGADGVLAMAFIMFLIVWPLAVIIAWNEHDPEI